MTTTRTSDVEATVAQIKRLEAVGCDIVRVAVPDMDSADAIASIKERIEIPLVADIHFDHKLALRAIERGADKIRINPGNIGGEQNVRTVAEACRAANGGKGIPIRIGVNSGSLEKHLLEKHGGVTAEAMVDSAVGHVALLNKFDFDDIWISAKCSNVPLTVQTYRLLNERTSYPLHIGVTEAGTEYNGIIKNAIGIGALLLDGIGDTIRVSLTAEPEREVIAAKAILKSLGLRSGIDIISCPTCGRCRIDVQRIAEQVEHATTGDGSSRSKSYKKRPQRTVPGDLPGGRSLTIAVMGCAVNGPGEASHADYGIAGGDGEGIIFAKGKIIKKVPEDKLVEALLELIV